MRAARVGTCTVTARFTAAATSTSTTSNTTTTGRLHACVGWNAVVTKIAPLKCSVKDLFLGWIFGVDEARQNGVQNGINWDLFLYCFFMSLCIDRTEKENFLHSLARRASATKCSVKDSFLGWIRCGDKMVSVEEIFFYLVMKTGQKRMISYIA